MDWMEYDRWEAEQEALESEVYDLDQALYDQEQEYRFVFGERKEADAHVELFTRWEHELSLPDHYGNRAYTHWFVEVAL